MTTALTTIESHLLTPSDRERVAEALRNLDGRDELPEAVIEGLRRLFNLVAAGRDATVVGADEQLTSNQAAALLGMSRPLLNKLLDDGRIPFHRNGRDRRIAMSDVTTYVAERDRLKTEHAEVSAGYEQRRTERLARIAGASSPDRGEIPRAL